MELPMIEIHTVNATACRLVHQSDTKQKSLKRHLIGKNCTALSMLHLRQNILGNVHNAYQNCRNGLIQEFTYRMQPARLAIFFKENQFITSKRSELYGRTDFVANCGGLLGLFMGVSLLSIVEIIYHITLRLCCSLRKRTTNETNNKISMKPLPADMDDDGDVIDENGNQ